MAAEIKSLAEMEKDAIIEAILHFGSVSKAAIALQIDRVTIYRILARHGLTLKASELLAELRRQSNLKFVAKRNKP